MNLLHNAQSSTICEVDMKTFILPFYIAIVLYILVLPMTASSQNYIQPFKNGKIDWSNGVAEAIAIGIPPVDPVDVEQARAMAEKEAVTSARRHLLEIIGGIQVESQTYIKDLTKGSEKIGKEIDHLLKESDVVDVAYLKDGSVMVTVTLKLLGSLADLVLPKTIRRINPVKQSGAPNKEKGDAYTGLVLDCRGFEVITAMAPEIVDEDGKVVYGSAYVSRDYAVKKGMAGYTRDFKANEVHPRVGERPLVVKGIRTAKSGPSDIVVSNADSAKIRGTASNLSFLKQCRVLIVLD